MNQGRMRIAVVGGGVAGIVTSYLLSRQHEVVLFEKNNYIGGHTNTVNVLDGTTERAVDTGFIVLNDKTYPLFHKFLADLQVPVRWSDMSFSYFDEASNFQYAGTTLNGLFALRKNLLSPRYYKFLLEIARFCKNASEQVMSGTQGEQTLGEFLDQGKYSADMIEWYLLPMGAAIWSAPIEEIRQFPAITFFRFFKNHGLLSLVNRPRWQTVEGGSQAYVRKFLQIFTGSVHRESRVRAIRRAEDQGAGETAGQVIVILEDGRTEQFDKIVVACHADEALKLLEQPSEEEAKLLGAWTYQRNHTVLHTDTGMLPPLRRSWASWNYLRWRDNKRNAPVAVTYHMNGLQGFTSSTQYCVTLNAAERIDKRRVIKEFEYHHPTYSLNAIRSQEHLSLLQGKRNTYFCGSYFGYGFHEDAVRSAVRVAELFDIEL